MTNVSMTFCLKEVIELYTSSSDWKLATRSPYPLDNGQSEWPQQARAHPTHDGADCVPSVMSPAFDPFHFLQPFDVGVHLVYRV
jgi:hypothetical protein